MRVIIVKDYEEVSRRAAKIVSDRLRRKPDLVLGLATGSTAVGLYQEFIKTHKRIDYLTLLIPWNLYFRK